MPIDPVQLRAQAAAAAADLAEPPDCAAAIRRLLEHYADHAHRYSPRLTDSAPPNELKTPAPVLRAVVAALRRPVRASPAHGLALAEALWTAGTREERRLAAEVLGLVAPQLAPEVWALVEAWLPELDSGETADALAQHALGPLLASAAYEAVQRAGRWTQAPNRWLRRFGVAVLAALARDRRWDDVPAALDGLRGLMGEREPAVRQAVVAALQALAARNPSAVIRFVREHASRSDHNTHAILRGALRALPAEAQAELVRALRA